MLRISRFIKKDKLSDILADTNVVKVTLRRCKNSHLRDITVHKIDVYLFIGTQEFHSYCGTLLDKEYKSSTRSNELRSTITTAKRDTFIKESAFEDFDSIVYPPSKVIKNYLSKYTQQYFWDL